MNTSNTGDCWLFSDGLAAVKIKNRWGFIDKHGEIVIEPKYDDVCGFSEGLAAVKVGKKYGFIDRNDNMVIAPQFGFTIAFSEGLAVVINDNDFLVIDKKGNTVLPLGDKWADVECFSCGLAAVEIESENDGELIYKYGFVDRSGRVVVKPQFDWVGSFSDGLALATLETNGPSGYIDTTGYLVVKPQYDDADNFSEGLAPVKKDGKWRFIDRTGAEVAMLGDRFESVLSLTEGRSVVRIGEKFGAIDRVGNLIIDVRYDLLFPFSEGLAFARIGDTQGFINTSGVFEIQKPTPKPTLIDILKGRKNHIRW